MTKRSPGGIPYRSMLVPFEELIRELRQRRRTYAQIAEHLRDEHGLAVHRGTIHRFVKVRSKKFKGYRLPAPEPAPVPQRPVPSRPSTVRAGDQPQPAPLTGTFNDEAAALARLKAKSGPSADADDRGLGGLIPSERYNLTRLPPRQNEA